MYRHKYRHWYRCSYTHTYTYITKVCTAVSYRVLAVGIFSTANLTPIKRKALELMDRLDEFVQRTPIDKEHPPGPWADYLINGRTTSTTPTTIS
jgi:hypothetical protein